MNTEIIAKGVKFSRKALEELDYNSIQVSKWTADADKNELIKQVILNYLKNSLLNILLKKEILLD